MIVGRGVVEVNVGGGDEVVLEEGTLGNVSAAVICPARGTLGGVKEAGAVHTPRDRTED